MSGLQPIWTPDDARQAARDAAQHVGISGELVDDTIGYGLPGPELRATGGRHRAQRAVAAGHIAVAVVSMVVVMAVAVLWATSGAR